MALVTSIYRAGFHELFLACGREYQFSYDGLNILYSYLYDLSDDLGENIDIDVIALCCDYSEEDANDIAKQYSIDLGDLVEYDDETEIVELVLAYLNEHTAVAGRHGSTIVFQQF